MDRGGLADRPVKLAEAASLSDDPWYGQRLDLLTHDLAARTREVLRIHRQIERETPARGGFSLRDHAVALFAWTRRTAVTLAGARWRLAVRTSPRPGGIPAARSAPGNRPG